MSCGIPEERVTELDWWNETILSFPPATLSSSSSDLKGDLSSDEPLAQLDLALKFAFTPAQHRSGRGLLDHMKTLWGSWMFGVIGENEWDNRKDRGMKGWRGFKCYFGG